MKREYVYKGITFYIGNYTPRRNEWEKGLKYKLYVGDIPTSHNFETIRACKEWIRKFYWIWL